MRKKVKLFMQSNRWLKCVPNFLTVCNSLCGFTAILCALYTYSNNSENLYGYLPLAVSAVFILFAMVFDAFDGFTARMFNCASMHGIQMDSLADMVTFGVAPAVCAAIMAQSYLPNFIGELKHAQYLLIWLSCALYVACAALRLATYNVHAIQHKKSGENFSGLPSPGAAATICALIFFYTYCKYHDNQFGQRIVMYSLPFYAAMLGLLMTSTFQYVHAMKWLLSVRRNKKRLLMLLVIIAALVFFKIWAFMALINVYLLSAPCMALIRRCSKKFDKKLHYTQLPSPPQSPSVDGLS